MTALPAMRILPDLSQPWRDAPVFIAVTGLAILGLLPLWAAMALDARQFQGDSVWLKPVKFQLALAVYLGTLAIYARFLPDGLRASVGWRLFAWAVGFAVVAEMVWIGGAASIGAASHFNTDVPFLTGIYRLMGVFAVLLTSASLVMGIAIWRNRHTGLAPELRLALALGLILTFVLTVGVAGYLSASGTHFVGASTRTMAVMGWSRDAGDLRVAHFLATHAMHALPLAGLLALRLPPATGRLAVLGAAAGYAGLVAFTFWQARAGLPFLPLIG